MYGVAQTRTRLLGRRTLNPQAVKQVLSECAIPTSRQNLSQIQYLNPLPVAPARLWVKGHVCGKKAEQTAGLTAKKSSGLVVVIFSQTFGGGYSFNLFSFRSLSAYEWSSFSP